MTDEPQPTAAAEATLPPTGTDVPVEPAVAAKTPSATSDVVLAPASNPPASISLAQPRPVTPVPLSWRSWPVVDSLTEFLMLAHLNHVNIQDRRI